MALLPQKAFAQERLEVGLALSLPGALRQQAAYRFSLQFPGPARMAHPLARHGQDELDQSPVVVGTEAFDAQNSRSIRL